MRRVVITGMGITSCLGDDLNSVNQALQNGQSGIRHMPEYEKMGLRSHVAGVPAIDLVEAVDRRIKRFMGDGAAYAYVAMRDAIKDAGLDEDMVSHPKTGLIAGSGGASIEWQIYTADTLRERGLRRVGPFQVPRTMSSTVSATLSTTFGIKGLSYSISAACATSAHCIGAAVNAIKSGQQDIMFAGGGEEEHWAMTAQFDAMGALSTKRNDQPHAASRPYDADRDGFVIAGGGGMLVLEDYERAKARGAHIYAEILGYGVTSDGVDMVAPGGDGAMRAMQMAMADVDAPVDYLNTHGTSTPKGDLAELQSVRKVFGDDVPPLSSTKSLTGHSLGAASVHEAIYCLLMMQNDFIAASANVETVDEAARDFPIVTATRQSKLTTVMSNSFGFGGTNATLVLGKV